METAASRLPRLQVAGESFEDLIFAGLPRLPGPGEEIRTPHFERTYGGGALIAAAWARSEGVGVELLSGLPPGASRVLRTEGIAYRNLRKAGEPHAVTACLSFGDERSFATFPGVNPDIEPRIYGALNADAPPEAVLLAMTPSACHAWEDWQLRQRRSLPPVPEVFWDFGYDDHLPGRDGFAELLESAAGVFVNAREAALYNGPRRVLDRAAEAGTLVVVKSGADGAMILGRPETAVPAPIPLHGVRDTTGAGDAFAAGFLARRLRGGSLEEQLAAGNACGARCVQRLGGLPERPWSPTR